MMKVYKTLPMHVQPEVDNHTTSSSSSSSTPHSLRLTKSSNKPLSLPFKGNWTEDTGLPPNLENL